MGFLISDFLEISGNNNGGNFGETTTTELQETTIGCASSKQGPFGGQSSRESVSGKSGLTVGGSGGSSSLEIQSCSASYQSILLNSWGEPMIPHGFFHKTNRPSHFILPHARRALSSMQQISSETSKKPFSKRPKMKLATWLLAAVKSSPQTSHACPMGLSQTEGHP